MAPNKSTQRTFVALKLPRRVPAIIPYVQSVVTAMTHNASFPAPDPSLAEIGAANAALQAAETAVLSRLRGTVVVRNDKLTALITLMGQLGGYVQKIADADPENAAAIIQSAGLAVRKPKPLRERVFAVRPGAISGSVDVVAPRAAKRASYEWRYSTDGGTTWIEVAPSLRAATTITGLPVVASVHLRYRAITKAGPGDWSQPLAIVVK
ncbi:MAG TPA: hypothetical protein VF765_27755 [Polyangiaceae bacterium]